VTSFKSRTTLVPARANTIGPGLFLKADWAIGGCDGTMGRGMLWQGLSLWATLRYGPDKWVPSSFMPTLPGRLFFLKELAGPLVAECN
jgi:glucosamine-6-phosphate deaminase